MAQADCIIFFKYVGSISNPSIKIAKIGLPTTDFLDGFVNKKDEAAFMIFELNDSAINQILISHLSSEFCSGIENAIKNVFKKREKGYLIKVFEAKTNNSSKYKIREILLPLSSIEFTTEIINGQKGIVINLGRIKL